MFLPMKYKAFISYKHSTGRPHAESLEKALKNYAKPLLASPIKIFRDEKHLVPGDGLSQLIKDGLEQSEYLLFLAEKQAAASNWCQDELEYWCHTLKRTDKLIIVHIGDRIDIDQKNDTIDWDHTSALPQLLKTYVKTIPFYVDLSWVKKDQDSDLENIQYRTIINSLTAKFRGVTPEEINDEEIRVYRRNKRLRNGAIVILLTLLLISAMTTWWALNRNAYAQEKQRFAESQQRYAEQQERIAQQERDTANAQKQRVVVLMIEKKRQEALKKQALEDTAEALADKVKEEKLRIQTEETLNNRKVNALIEEIDIYLAAGYKEDALKALKEALSIAPSHPRLLEFQETLKE